MEDELARLALRRAELLAALRAPSTGVVRLDCSRGTGEHDLEQLKKVCVTNVHPGNGATESAVGRRERERERERVVNRPSAPEHERERERERERTRTVLAARDELWRVSLDCVWQARQKMSARARR